MEKKNIFIIGGTSGIGRALAEYYLDLGCVVGVSGRRQALLDELKRVNPTRVFTYASDIKALACADLIKSVHEDMGKIDIIIICSGIGEINASLNAGPELDTVKTNVLGFTDAAIAAYNYFERNLPKYGGQGALAGISSIASFRGSDLAPSYYASKAYVSNYLEGLRKKALKNKLNLKVCTIIPGFVDTAMAKGVGGKEGLFWVAPADKAARQIAGAIMKGSSVAYITKRWRLIAWILKVLPDFVYNKI